MKDNTSNNVIEFSHQQIDDDFKVEYAVNYLYDSKYITDGEIPLEVERLSEIDLRQRELEDGIDELNNEIERLTNKSDRLDYTIAVGCGVLCGLIDSFLVGAFDFEGSLEAHLSYPFRFSFQRS